MTQSSHFDCSREDVAATMWVARHQAKLSDFVAERVHGWTEIGPKIGLRKWTAQPLEKGGLDIGSVVQRCAGSLRG